MKVKTPIGVATMPDTVFCNEDEIEKPVIFEGEYWNQWEADMECPHCSQAFTITIRTKNDNH